MGQQLLRERALTRLACCLRNSDTTVQRPIRVSAQLPTCSGGVGQSAESWISVAVEPTAVQPAGRRRYEREALRTTIPEMIRLTFAALLLAATSLHAAE